MNRWSVLTSATGHELSAASAIIALGHEAYCPTSKHFTKPKRKSSRIEVVSAAFPGYLFMAEGNIDLSSPDLKTSRLRHLRLGEEFCSVSEDEIERLRSEDDLRVTLDKCVKFYAGDHVKVSSGPLVDREGLVISVKGSRCELSITGANAKIFMPDFSLKLKSRAVTAVQ